LHAKITNEAMAMHEAMRWFFFIFCSLVTQGNVKQAKLCSQFINGKTGDISGSLLTSPEQLN
jgi:hypothetical protein